MTTTKSTTRVPLAGRKTLTPHQRWLLERLVRLSRQGTKAVLESDIGSVGGLAHLQAKGYAHVATTENGPRGGRYRYWLPTAPWAEYQS